MICMALVCLLYTHPLAFLSEKVSKTIECEKNSSSVVIATPDSLQNNQSSELLLQICSSWEFVEKPVRSAAARVAECLPQLIARGEPSESRRATVLESELERPT